MDKAGVGPYSPQQAGDQAEATDAQYRTRGIAVEVRHRDVDKSVIIGKSD